MKDLFEGLKPIAEDETLDEYISKIIYLMEKTDKEKYAERVSALVDFNGLVTVDTFDPSYIDDLREQELDEDFHKFISQVLSGEIVRD